ncbi:5-oxoprolinase subunit PxpA [Streptomyces sp. NPDC093085]|uniref:LamB/YcsF family protein n=1 Tax=Streptomyces sp. NPDC093085 TaxID=3155068 RepID=UPI00342ADE54
MHPSPLVSTDLNCDIGEGFGRWRMPADAELMELVTTVNVAAGFHAGDPSTLRATVDLAAGHGLDIGAHVALPDLVGFGRRRMEISAQEAYDLALYQIGAVAGFARAAGTTLTHVKPHGALYVMASTDRALAEAIARATAAVGPALRLFLLDARFAEPVLAAYGVRVEPEGFPDLAYAPDGGLVLERTKEPRPPELVARRAVRMATGHTVEATDGSAVPVHARTLCLHSDAPDAAATARAVREALAAHDVAVRPLSALG